MQRAAGAAVLSSTGTIVLAGGYYSPSGTSTTLRDVWASPDCVQWTQLTALAAWSARGYFGFVAVNNYLIVLTGETAPTAGSIAPSDQVLLLCSAQLCSALLSSAPLSSAQLIASFRAYASLPFIHSSLVRTHLLPFRTRSHPLITYNYSFAPAC
jgi:hypothetical protein